LVRLAKYETNWEKGEFWCPKERGAAEQMDYETEVSKSFLILNEQ
jgi:hypothetical protein